MIFASQVPKKDFTVFDRIVRSPFFAVTDDQVKGFVYIHLIVTVSVCEGTPLSRFLKRSRLAFDPGNTVGPLSALDRFKPLFFYRILS
jgi:hypothetical protein